MAVIIMVIVCTIRKLRIIGTASIRRTVGANCCSSDVNNVPRGCGWYIYPVTAVAIDAVNINVRRQMQSREAVPGSYLGVGKRRTRLRYGLIAILR